MLVCVFVSHMAMEQWDWGTLILRACLPLESAFHITSKCRVSFYPTPCECCLFISDASISHRKPLVRAEVWNHHNYEDNVWVNANFKELAKRKWIFFVSISSKLELQEIIHNRKYFKAFPTPWLNSHVSNIGTNMCGAVLQGVQGHSCRKHSCCWY